MTWEGRAAGWLRPFAPSFVETSSPNLDGVRCLSPCYKRVRVRDRNSTVPLAASVGWDKRTDKLGHEIEKRNERDAFWLQR